MRFLAIYTKICTNENFPLYDNSLRWLDIHHKLRINSSKALAWILHASTCFSKRYLTVTTQATKQLSFLVDQQQGYRFLRNNRRPSNGGTHVQLAADFDIYSIAHSYSTVHVKGKCYKSVSRGDPVSYRRVSNCLHAGSMRATRTCYRTRVECIRMWFN